MSLLTAVVTPLAAVVLFLIAYAFAPWPGNLLGDAALLGVPFWAGTLALASGTAAVAIHAVRRQFAR